MNSYAERTQSNDGHAIAHTVAARQDGSKSGSAQFFAPGVIQLYSIVQPGNIKAKKGARIDTQDIERTNYGSTYVTKSNRVTTNGETFNPQTSETTTERESGNQIQQQSTLPSFKVSQNGFLAIPAEGQSKNLYADKNSVAQTNQVLATNGSEVRLQAQGAGISVPKNPANPQPTHVRPLKKVHAATPQKTNNGLVYNQVENALPHVACNNFIQLVLGAASVSARIAVLENEDGSEHETIKAPEPNEPIREIATIVSEESLSPSEFIEEIEDRTFTDDDKKTGMRDYERLTENKRQKRSRKLGINEFASPGIGEGYVIRSMLTNEKIDSDEQGVKLPQPKIIPVDNKTPKQRKNLRNNYLQALGDLDIANSIISKSRLDVPYVVQEMMQTWNEHYAGVVAKDGADTVSLENYNRAFEVEWEHERIFNNLFRDFAEFRNLVSAKVDSLSKTPKQDVIQQLVALAAQAPTLNILYQNALQEATQSFQTGLETRNHSFNEQFYFDMYGPGDQSFHSKFKGMSNNPVTLRITEDVDLFKGGVMETVQDLHNNIARWETIMNRHSLPDELQSEFEAIFTAGHLAETKAINNLQNATTRSQVGAVMATLNEESDTFRKDIRATMQGAYQAITGQVPNPAIHGADDILQNCKRFQDTYRWYQTIDAPFHYSLVLEDIAKILRTKTMF